MNAVDLGSMQGSLNKMAPASWQWRQAADWARELAQLVDTMQTWLARQLCSALPFQKVSHFCFPLQQYQTKTLHTTSQASVNVFAVQCMHLQVLVACVQIFAQPCDTTQRVLALPACLMFATMLSVKSNIETAWKLSTP